MGSRKALLSGKPASLVKRYRELERMLEGLGSVEIVARGRYALFRTTRIFADLVFTRDALRLVIILDRAVKDRLFFKIQAMSPRRVAHVAKLRTAAELRAVQPYLERAYGFARSERV